MTSIKLETFCKLWWESMTDEDNEELYKEYLAKAEEGLSYCNQNQSYYEKHVKLPLTLPIEPKIKQELGTVKIMGEFAGWKEMCVAFDTLGQISYGQLIVKTNPEDLRHFQQQMLSDEVKFKDKFK